MHRKLPGAQASFFAEAVCLVPLLNSRRQPIGCARARRLPQVLPGVPTATINSNVTPLLTNPYNKATRHGVTKALDSKITSLRLATPANFAKIPGSQLGKPTRLGVRADLNVK
jgi:hypothetical protein